MTTKKVVETPTDTFDKDRGRPIDHSGNELTPEQLQEIAVAIDEASTSLELFKMFT
jgi:hypothetical protein